MYMDQRTTIQVSDSLRRDLRTLAASRDKNYQELLQDMITVFKELDPGQTIISIPAKLTQKVESHIQDTDMRSVSEYTTFVLRTILSEDSTDTNTDLSKIQKRLRQLGYLQ